MAWQRRGPLLFRFLRANRQVGLFSGFNHCVAYGLVLCALPLDNVAKIAAGGVTLGILPIKRVD